MINFQTTNEDFALINSIVDRAAEGNPELQRMDLMMDITACHLNGTPLDLEALMEFNDFNFWHDLSGITSHLNRTTGKLEYEFLPRCSLKSIRPQIDSGKP